MPQSRTKILYVYAKSGGGHLAAARAIASAVDTLSPDFEHSFVDIFGDSPHFVQRLMNSGYIMLIYKLRWIWNVIYVVYSVPWVARFFIVLYKLFSKPQFQRMIVREKPDVIVLAYFLTEPAQQALAEIGWNGKLVTVVTDLYTPPNLWFLSKNAQYIVASERVRQQALSRGVFPQNITVFEGLTHQKYETPPEPAEKDEVAHRYGILPTLPMILLTGGGLGLKQTVSVLKKVLDQGIHVQIIAICGRNLRLKAQVDQLLSQYTDHAISAFGYVEDMHELIALSSLVVTKAGPATMMEVFLQHKNMILTDYIWRQELGNYQFIVNNKFGLFQEKPDDIVASIKKVAQGTSLGLKKPIVKNEIIPLGKWLIAYSKQVDKP
jgi:UDP-N-acetylglucosamine:LPS N-acetylglucosamine transferase